MIGFDYINSEWGKVLNSQYAKKDKSYLFEVSPRIMKTGENIITIHPIDETVHLSGKYMVLIFPYYDYDFVPFETHRDSLFVVEACDNSISFKYCFETEQMYHMMIGAELETGIALLLKSNLYALDNDLFDVTPLIGDLHCHTIHSDGFETPEGVLRTALKLNFDFIAITDHNSFWGASKARHYAELNNLPITVITGEEYSSSFTNMHIISLGANAPLEKDYYLLSKNEKNEKTTTSQLTKELCHHIHENGGLSVMCHPLWKPLHSDGTRGDVPLSLVKQLMEEEIFDAVEIVGGSPQDDIMVSQMQALWAMSYGATPDKIAYVGSTDSHVYSEDPICGKHFTMAFAKENSQTSIIDAIKQRQTVAIQIVDNKNALIFGTPRLSMYAQFYLKEILKMITN